MYYFFYHTIGYAKETFLCENQGDFMKKRKIYHPQEMKKAKRDVTTIIHRRYKILGVMIFLCFFTLVWKLYEVQITDYQKYADDIERLNNQIIEGPTAPRGRIYDRNGKLLVDNVPVKTIVYRKVLGTSTEKEIKMAYQVANYLEVEESKLKENDLKTFWILNHKEEANQKITEEEWQALDERKLTDAEIEKLKKERIIEEELSSYEKIDREAAYIYTLMNDGYSYTEKVIKKDDVTDEEYAMIAENLTSLSGFSTRLDWERYYPYGDTFRSILGNISSSESGVPAELKDSYLALGYELNDRVGISYLEAQYEALLKGEKTKYKVTSSGYEVVEEGHRGYDIVLTIDIELQKEMEKILEKELISTKKNDKYTKYLDRGFIVIQDPNTGEILAMAGKRVEKKNGKYKVYDETPGVINSIVTPGSSVKAASQIVGYETGSLKIGEVRNDACIKLAGAPLKCSHTRYGNINDVQALKYSSNTYQFHTAMKLAGANYRYNMAFKASQKDFDTYRKIFGEFGLGVKTGIDLPNETEGLIGTSTQGGLLLDLAIGQYDNYTPIQLSQYISTVANGGNRMKPYLLKAVYEPTKEKLTKLVFQTTPTVLNKLSTSKKYLDRVKLGLQMVFEGGGTGYGFINNKYKPAGKTGTSQSFIDTNHDQKIDTETLSTVLVAYAPYNKPKVTFTVVTPNVGTGDISFYQMSKINKRISQKVSKKYFEIYK